MGQPLEDLRTIMQYTLTKNMLFFKKQFPHLFEKFQNYQPTKAGLGLDPQGNLNLMSSLGALYPLTDTHPDLTSLCRHQVKDFFAKPFSVVFKMDSKDLRGSHFKHIPLLNRVVKLGEDCFNRSQQSNEALSLYKKMPCFFVFGVGVGLHLDTILERAEDIDHLVIYEPNPDFFYASLHLVDYERLCREFTKNNKSFSLFVGIDKHDLFYKFYRLLYQVGIYKSAILYCFKHYNFPEINDAFQFITRKMSVVHTGFGFFEDEIISARSYHEGSFLNKQLLSAKVKQPLDIPVFICANGPSIDYAISFIKENKDKVFLISCGTVLKVLCQHGIYPDIHIEVERTDIVPDSLKEWDPEGKHLKNIDLICNNTLSVRAVKMFKTATFFLKPNDYSSEVIMGVTNERYKKMLYLFFSNPTVFNAGLAIAMHYQAKEIYCFGTDLGFKDAEKHHSKDSSYYTGNLNYDRAKTGRIHTVPGNFGGEVKTDMIYNWSREIIEDLIQKRKTEDCTIYNTSDGALIDGAVPLRVEDIRTFESCEYFDRNWIKNNLSGEMISGSAYRKRAKKCLHKSMELLDFFTNPAYLQVNFDESNILDLLIRNHLQVKSLQQDKTFLPAIRMTEGSILYLNSTVLGFMKVIERASFRNEFARKVVPLYINYFKGMQEVAEAFDEETESNKK